MQFFLIFFSLLSNNCNAMQLPFAYEQSKIIQVIKQDLTPLAIASSHQGTLVILDQSSCRFYRNNEIFHLFRTTLDRDNSPRNKIYMHPKKGVCIVPHDREKHYFLCDYKKRTGNYYGSTIKNKHSNIIFNRDSDIFYTFSGDQLCMRDCAILEFREFKTGIKPGILFHTWPFLCCDIEQQSMYELKDCKKGILPKKLFDFVAKLDLLHWVYSSELGLLCALTQDNRQLYIANTQTLEQTIVPQINNFNIGTLELLANKRVLALLSEPGDTICYFDLRKFQPLLMTTHEISDGDRKCTARGQKMTSSSDGQDIIIALSDKCLVVRTPVWVNKIDIYEKYRMINYMYLPKELHNLIAMFWVAMNRINSFFTKIE